MAVSEEKAQELFLTLITITRDLGLDWVSNQILDEINRGKEQVVRAKRRRGKQFYELAQPFNEAIDKSTRESGIQTTEYSARERLELLLNSLEYAVTHVSRMEQELVEKHKSIIFIPEQEQPQGRIEFSSRSTEHTVNIEKLQGLISRLRAEVR